LGGHSGAGKSTLLKLICAIERPTDGKIHFNGHDITRIPSKDIPFLRRNIGIVFQDHRLLMDRSVYDNVALPMRIESISETEIKRRVS
ncbi:ATP-binding cassette domain-containing protein, partial [Escherichia coli]|nr:ATP-binding cassette domain-containing protein [Escherichia coli]